MVEQVVDCKKFEAFYWKVKFEDGFEIAQFDSDGNETLIKDFVGDECWRINDKRRPELDFTKNFFAKLEETHGRTVEAGYHPFTEKQKKRIEIVQPIVTVLLAENPKPYTLEIPEGFFPFLKKEFKTDMKVVNDKKGFVVKGEGETFLNNLQLGYLPKDGDFSKGRIIKHRINRVVS